MKAVILAAGLGTRMGELTKNIPKPMLPIAGKPILEHHFLNLKKIGVTDFCVNLHYLPEKIRDYFGDGKSLGINIQYSFEPKVLGTAGALKKMSSNLDGDFFLVYGDVLNKFDFQKLYDFHKEKGGLGAVAVNKVNPATSDLVQLDDNQKIIKLFKKPHEVMPENGWSMAAIYILNDKILSFIPEGVSNLDHEIIPGLIESGMNFYGYKTDSYLWDIGDPEKYQKAQKDFENFS